MNKSLVVTRGLENYTRRNFPIPLKDGGTTIKYQKNNVLCTVESIHGKLLIYTNGTIGEPGEKPTQIDINELNHYISILGNETKKKIYNSGFYQAILESVKNRNTRQS